MIWEQGLVHARFLVYPINWLHVLLSEIKELQADQNHSWGNRDQNHITVMLSFSLCSFSLFGMTAVFLCIPQLRMTWAGEPPYFKATFLTSSCWKKVDDRPKIPFCQLKAMIRWATDQGVNMRQSKFPSLRNTFSDLLVADMDVLQLGWLRAQLWHGGARSPKFW